MIQFVQTPPCGNAVGLTVYAGGGLDGWRVLRKETNTFSGYDDPDAVIVAESEYDLDDYYPLVDYSGLVNGRTYWYLHYIRVDGDWSASAEAVSAVPAYQPGPLFASPDFAGFVRERLSLGLAAEIEAGYLKHATIPVLAANPQIESVRMPLLTVMLEDRRAEVRGIGELVIPDQAIGDMIEVTEGWLDRSSLQIIVWALNHEERLRIRDATQRIIMLNLPILDAEGYYLPELGENDSFDAESYSAPVYQSVFKLSCQHAALVRSRVPVVKISESIINVNENPN